jgi:polyhydroxyalkanoate synthesis regulator phasin
MNATVAKRLRRELRRTAGSTSIAALEEAQRNIQALANSLAVAHKRLDEAVSVSARLEARIAYLETELRMKFVPDYRE